MLIIALLALALAPLTAVVGLLAQEDPAGVIATYWPTVIILIPIVTAFATRFDAEKYVKLGVCGALAGAAALITGLGFEWSTITAEDLVIRAGAIFGAAQVTYHSAELLFRSQFGRGFNELSVFAPDRGIA